MASGSEPGSGSDKGERGAILWCAAAALLGCGIKPTLYGAGGSGLVAVLARLRSRG
ncbi:hypothetical protein [Phaeacidiphilus oryzae]|uniref:hypothetical protein n=1 Tax=Phaeacidiphilus oryzae TaxID=348818 RepID=UPI001377BBD8|nr:hypothetical protein [Phaeacidiphilus oryzae]